MKLVKVMAKNFKSIENGVVDNCGNFNVLIGKNNSGKSNILSSIEIFHQCIDVGVISTNSSIGKEYDFFRKNNQNPIEITLTFSLALAERDELVRNIVEEAPQMKNAIDGLDPSLLLSVTLNILFEPKFGYVKKICLVNNNDDIKKEILNINRDSAIELYYQIIEYERKISESHSINELLENIDPGDWERIKGDNNYSQRYLFRRSFLRLTNEKELRKIIEDSTSFNEFKRYLQTYKSQINDEANNLLDKPLKNNIETFSGEESKIPKYIKKLLKLVSNMKLHCLKDRRRPIGKKEAEKLLQLKVRRGGTEVLRNIQDIVSTLLGVKIDAFQSEQDSKDIAEMDVDNFVVEVNGSGIREALRLVLDIEFEKPDIILVEEPEIHLHPSLEYSIMRYLKQISSNTQVFLTTHSTNFLDTTDMENVYLISKSETTEIQHINYEEAENLIPEELGIRLSSLFMYDRLVFVEGPIDEEVFKEWATTLQMNISQSNIGFIEMHGARNFTHYAAEEILSFLSKRKVEIYFVMDKDEKRKEDINKIKDLLGDKAKIQILKKREIENYLLSPKAIIKFIKMKYELTYHKNIDIELSIDDITEKINECSEKLKQNTINRMLVHDFISPLYPNKKAIIDSSDAEIINNTVKELDRVQNILEDMKSKLDEQYDNSKKHVEEKWERNKLNIVPGDELLDLISREFNLRFKKEKDSSRLASLMDKDEIHEEIKQIIREWI